MANILVVDEDDLIRNLVAANLEKAGHKVAESASEDDAIELTERDIYDIVVVHPKPPQSETVKIFKKLEGALPGTEVIIVIDDSTTGVAVEAMKLGAWGYVVEPVSLQEIMLTVSKILEKRQLQSSVKHLRKQVMEKYRLENIVASSEEMLRVLELTNEASRNSGPVMITGENGTGKHLIGKIIHAASSRSRGPFIYVDLAAVDNEDMESILFGSVSGPTSGTTRNLRGAIERSDGGTIFLREIAAMPLRIQERMLEFLEYNTFSRSGSEEIIYVNARLIAISSADIEESVRSGALREDIFHKLSEIQIHLPPLRDRKDDIPLLVDHFVSKYSQQFEKQIEGMSEEALSLLVSYDWPGNVRELENAIERAVAFTSDGIIYQSDLQYSVQAFGYLSI